MGNFVKMAVIPQLWHFYSLEFTLGGLKSIGVLDGFERAV